MIPKSTNPDPLRPLPAPWESWPHEQFIVTGEIGEPLHHRKDCHRCEMEQWLAARAQQSSEPLHTPAPCPLPAKWELENADLLKRAGAIKDTDLGPENYAAYWTREGCILSLNVWLATRAQ
jgi:hypothetical protein